MVHRAIMIKYTMKSQKKFQNGLLSILYKQRWINMLNIYIPINDFATYEGCTLEKFADKFYVSGLFTRYKRNF